MNTVILKGTPQDITFSHSIGSTDYYQCNFLVIDEHSHKDDVILVKFKDFSNATNKLQIGKQSEIYGNLRSFTERTPEGKNHVVHYVFTYLDAFDNIDNDYNYVELDGRLCKKDVLWKNIKTGKHCLHFTLANNIYADGIKINSYISCTAYGKKAAEISELHINQPIKLIGKVHSRTYNKQLDNGDMEVRVAHEVIIRDYKVITENDL